VKIGYSFGGEMPGRIYNSGYRYSYQGQEDAVNSQWQAFELRLHNSDLGRWFAPDPYGQFHSPYISMANNPVSGVDPNGGWANNYSQGMINSMGKGYFNMMEAMHGYYSSKQYYEGELRGMGEIEWMMYFKALEWAADYGTSIDNYDDKYYKGGSMEGFSDTYAGTQSWTMAYADAAFNSMENGEKFDRVKFNNEFRGSDNRGSVSLDLENVLKYTYAGMGADNNAQSWGEIFSNINRANQAWEETKAARARAKQDNEDFIKQITPQHTGSLAGIQGGDDKPPRKRKLRKSMDEECNSSGKLNKKARRLLAREKRHGERVSGRNGKKSFYGGLWINNFIIWALKKGPNPPDGAYAYKFENKAKGYSRFFIFMNIVVWHN